MPRRLAALTLACVLACALVSLEPGREPARAGDRIAITVKARLTGWVARRDGVFLYRPGATARLVVGVWPTLRDEPVRARLEWRRPGARWRLLEVSTSRLNRDSRALFLVRRLPEGYTFRIRARVPAGEDHRAGRSPWRYFRAV